MFAYNSVIIRKSSCSWLKSSSIRIVCHYSLILWWNWWCGSGNIVAWKEHAYNSSIVAKIFIKFLVTCRRNIGNHIGYNGTTTPYSHTPTDTPYSNLIPPHYEMYTKKRKTRHYGLQSVVDLDSRWLIIILIFGYTCNLISFHFYIKFPVLKVGIFWNIHKYSQSRQ